jgi:7,8-dihydropterin-6-yl-methyl-4-(beta-D-ribofuranosyl)aminobenzene 5'-phosphate synthase
MTPEIRVAVLAENTAQGPGLLGEYGLAYWIEARGRVLLFDTGQGMALESNARRLGVDLAAVEAVVLSHGHYDHTGGLPAALSAAPRPTLYAHCMAFQPKYTRQRNEAVREIGMPAASLRAVRDAGVETVWTTRPMELLPDVWATGPIPRETPFEDTGGSFFLDADCLIRDPLEDDQAVFFDSAQGTVVLLGCAHSGLVNTLSYIRRLTDDRPIHAVLGGTHLLNATPARLADTIERLTELGAPRLGPAHCTGMKATTTLWSAFPDRCLACGAGSRFEFHPPL